MAQSRQNQSRGFVRHGTVVESIRDAIVKGRHPPGSRLPAQIDLQRRFRTTPVTVQRAVHQLRAEGFIRVRPNAGTYVADHLPHLWRYGLLFPDAPGDALWSRYCDALKAIAEETNACGPRQIEMYFGINGHTDSEGYQRLLRDIDAHRLAGMMFTFAPHELLGSPLVEKPPIPMVIPSWSPGRFPVVGWEWGEPTFSALKWIAAQGRKKVSIITTVTTEQAYLQKVIEDVGLTALPFWIQAADPYHTAWVRHAVYGILHSHPSTVPEVMLVTDDHLLEAVTDALIEFGVRVPDDMLVIGHWNFPLEFRPKLPVQLIGPDNADVMRRWVATIDAQVRGDSFPMTTVVKPIIPGDLLLTSPAEIQQLPPPGGVAPVEHPKDSATRKK